MNIQLLKTTVFAALEPEFAKDGFIFRKSKNDFVHRSGETECDIYFDFIRWSTSFSIQIRVHVYYLPVKRMLTTLDSGLKIMPLIGADISYLHADNNYTSRIINKDASFWFGLDEDPAPHIERMKRVYSTVIIPFFEYFSNLQVMDRYFNDRPQHTYLMTSYRIPQALLLARLAKRTDLDLLIESYTAEILANNNKEWGQELLAFTNKIIALPDGVFI